jgi:folate-dependent phosphoribosylglycinamide formyltransferase PurN
MSHQEDKEPEERDSGGSAFKVVVLSCGALGVDVANRLQTLPQVSQVILITSPWRQVRRNLPGKLRHIYRTQGLPGLLSVVAAKLGLGRDSSPVRAAPTLAPGIEQLVFEDFHSEECLAAISSYRPDLGVLAGTYILRESVFGIPQLGSVNLHCGKVPDYRGAAPAFWELYNGETEVGVTVHQVESALDAGHVYRQELFPLDPAPPADPLVYLAQYREEVLQPAGVRLLAEAVAGLAQGSARGVPQDISRARTYRSPDYRAVCELRRRVAARRTQLQRKGVLCGRSI